jgi:hypothetical protein
MSDQDDERPDEVEEEELPDSIDVQPEDPRHEGTASPRPIDE